MIQFEPPDQKDVVQDIFLGILRALRRFCIAFPIVIAQVRQHPRHNTKLARLEILKRVIEMAARLLEEMMVEDRVHPNSTLARPPAPRGTPVIKVRRVGVEAVDWWLQENAVVKET